MNVPRIATLGLLFVLGVVVGLTGALVQGGWSGGGLLLALLASAGLFVGGAHLTGTRAGAWAPAAGWLLAVIVASSPRPEGDFLFGAGIGAYVFLLGGTAVAVMCATLLRPPPAGAPKDADRSR
ncbi:DUF6113 family protein [Streptomyces sp. NPDC060194]|uniref:DUF6113 family protein n=1 Tax=Streptomyces sp. NPDC060194 TaxID=3347069 RepID=UPI003662A642